MQTPLREPLPPPDERHEIYVRYYERVVRYLVARFDFSVDDARDLAQDVFLSVFSHMDQQPIVAMWRFLVTAAHHRAVNEIRSRIGRRRREIGSLEAVENFSEILLHDFWTDEAPPSPEIVAIVSQESELLREAIEELSPTLRPCVLLRLRGLSYEEIASALVITVNAVRTRLRDAKKILLSRMRSGGN
jgi:RNA polymerase sigma factor (sigma-70 family)